jgi:hypothetical protein
MMRVLSESIFKLCGLNRVYGLKEFLQKPFCLVQSLPPMAT